MKRYWYDVSDRGTDTVAVWSNRAPAFAVGELLVAAHALDVNALGGCILQMALAEDGLDTARDSRDTGVTTLRDLCTRGCRLIAGTAPANDVIADKVRAVYGVKGQSFRAVEERSYKLISAWQAVNDHRTGISQPPLLVGTTPVSSFQSLVGNYAQLLRNVSNKEDSEREKRTALRTLVDRVDKNNKRWYRSWQGQFATGSPERAALAQIDTGPSQTIPGQGVFFVVEALQNLTLRLGFGAARATSFTLLHKGPASAVFAVLADGLTMKSFEHATGEVGEHQYKLVPHNSAGDGPESVVLKVQVAQQAAA